MHSENELIKRIMMVIKGAGRTADLKINKSVPLPKNYHTFSITELIYTK